MPSRRAGEPSRPTVRYRPETDVIRTSVSIARQLPSPDVVSQVAVHRDVRPGHVIQLPLVVPTVVVQIVELPVLQADKQVAAIDPMSLDPTGVPSVRARPHRSDPMFTQRFAALLLILCDDRGQYVR